MLAQAMSNTSRVIPKSMLSGVEASVRVELCPSAPGTRTICLVRNSCIVLSLIPSWRATSVFSRIAVYWGLIAADACSIDTPGLRRPKR